MVSVVVFAVEKLPEASCSTQTVSPLAIVDGSVVNVPLQPME